MKKSKIVAGFLILFFFAAGLSGADAQGNFKDFFNDQTPVTYLGVDFTQVKIAGLTDFDLRDLKERHFSAINNLPLNEREKKYDFSKFFHRSNTQKDISFAEAHNSKIEVDQLKSVGAADENRLNPAAIDKLVKGYGFSGKKAIGVLLIAEAFSKTKGEGTMYAAFIDLANGKVIHTEKFTEKAGGFGMRNYWAKVVLNTLEDIGDKYDDWKKTN